ELELDALGRHLLAQDCPQLGVERAGDEGAFAVFPVGLVSVPFGEFLNLAAAQAWHNASRPIIDQQLLSLGFSLLAITRVRLSLPCTSLQQPFPVRVQNASALFLWAHLWVGTPSA